MQIYSFLARKENISLKKTPFFAFCHLKTLNFALFIRCDMIKDGSDFACRLLAWYHENGRILPWRGTRDPYVVWISEIILQQTRVSQGHDYFLRFVERFPDVGTLAAASEDEVLKCWQGLGYYSRARNLHAAARQVVERGGFPDTYPDIRKMKGVGDYTAAAIASFAFGLPYAVVDGNVYRVLSRFFGVEEPIDTGRGRKYFAALAQELLPETGLVAGYNQALMDFGAMQCVPKGADCGVCPLSDGCVAFRDGRVRDFPVKSRSLAVKERYLHYIYIKVGGETALFRREGNDIWKGLYEPWLMETEEACPPERLWDLEGMPVSLCRKEAVRTLLCEGVRHQLTHRTLVCDLQVVELPEKPADLGRKAVWVRAGELAGFAFPRLVAKWLERFSLT